MASGVAQHSPPRLEIVSQLPPFPVYTAELKLKFVPVLATARICGKGFAPPWGMVKLIAFTCAKTLGPTTTLTGMVTSSPVVCSTSCPLKVPAASPLEGRALGLIDTLTVEGAVPLKAEAVNQLPPSAVLVDSVQCNVPVPAFLIWMAWAAGAMPFVVSEKLT